MRFLFSSLFPLGGITSTVSSIFSIALPSTNQTYPSLTIYNTAANYQGFSVGVCWPIIAAILVTIYTFIQYKVFKGKMDDVGYGEQ
jgi:cytochrome d ubiquinol oxidase subunit II